METLLNFLSDLILFTAGLAVVVFWLIIILVVIDEIIDLFVDHRSKRIDELTKED